MDSIGGDVFARSYHLLDASGRLVVYGAAKFTPAGNRLNKLTLAVPYLMRPKIDPMSMMSDNKSVMGFNLIWMWEKADLLEILVKQIMGLNPPKPKIDRVFQFENAKEAL